MPMPMPRGAVIAAGLLLFASAQVLAEPPAVMQRYACSACHQLDVRAVGPSWREIAARYRDGSKGTGQLVQSIRQGSRGQWGVVPMPPQAQAREEDLQAITQWILEQR
ncbi:c-type cytochrome [Pseudomonas sp. RW10S2]|nr:c-type cytochrome [Pseudomonas sp. RW10S2]QXI45386.1 c-type cytochrome [Pseudomonas wayambapalatensis]